MKKRTIGREVQFSGQGVHTGQPVSITLKPSERGRIIFRRQDLGGKEVALDWQKARAESSSLLVDGSVTIRTVEHLLAALYVFGVDSLEIELDGEEIPIADGSALPFVSLVKQAGWRFLEEEKRCLRVTQELRIDKGKAWIKFSPASDFRLIYSIDYPHPLIGVQKYEGYLRFQNFIREIAPARTFGFLKDVSAMRERGLARGGSLENAIVLDEETIINPPLRYPDEFVRHKVADLIGDLALLGKPILAQVEVYRGGHELHQQGLATLLASPDYWREETGKFPVFLEEID